MTTPAYSPGLEGVIAGETAICTVEGGLSYRGYFVGDLAAVWGPATDDLWAAGSAGAIAHYDGESWRQVTHQTIGAPYLRQFLALHGTSSIDIWVVGQELGEGGSSGLIYHYQP